MLIFNGTLCLVFAGHKMCDLFLCIYVYLHLMVEGTKGTGVAGIHIAYQS